MKKWKVFLVAFMACLFSMFLVVSADAASYQKVMQNQKQKIGKYYFWISESGSLYVEKNRTESGKYIKGGYPSVITNGKVIYYGKSSNDTLGIYRYNIAKDTTETLGTVKHGEYIEGYYKGKLYIGTHMVTEYGCEWIDFDTSVYNLKTGKSKIIMKGISAGPSYKQYLVGSPNSGAVVELPLKVYNMKTGKTKTITTKNIGYSVIGKYVYYAQAVRPIERGWKTKIYKYNLTTGKKRCVATNLEAQGVSEFTKKSVTYMSTTGVLKTAYLK